MFQTILKFVFLKYGWITPNTYASCPLVNHGKITLYMFFFKIKDIYPGKPHLQKSGTGFLCVLGEWSEHKHREHVPGYIYEPLLSQEVSNAGPCAINEMRFISLVQLQSSSNTVRQINFMKFIVSTDGNNEIYTCTYDCGIQ